MQKIKFRISEDQSAAFENACKDLIVSFERLSSKGQDTLYSIEVSHPQTILHLGMMFQMHIDMVDVELKRLMRDAKVS